MEAKIYYTRNDSKPKFLYLDFGIELHAEPGPGRKEITFELPDGCTVYDGDYKHSQFITSPEIIVDNHGEKHYLIANNDGLHMMRDTYYGAVSETIRINHIEK